MSKYKAVVVPPDYMPDQKPLTITVSAKTDEAAARGAQMACFIAARFNGDSPKVASDYTVTKLEKLS